MSYYLIRVGAGAKYAEEAFKNKFVGIDWNAIDSLANYDSFEGIKRQLGQHYNYTPAQLGMAAGQVYRFGCEIEAGDTVFMPMGDGKYAVGEVGNYYWVEKPNGKCPYQHRRSVDWQKDFYSKRDMTTKLSYGMGAIMTLFSLDKYSDEIEALLSGEEYSPEEKPLRIRDQVLSQLMELDGKEFEHFVMHLLNVIGFNAETTQYTNDKGIDVVGILDAEGLADITVRVQVKRKTGAIGRRVVQELRGAVNRDEHPCIITTGSFHKNAEIEASDTNKVPVKLVDGDDLASLVLKHFDNLDDEYKRLLGIRRKKIAVEDQFELSNLDPTSIERGTHQSDDSYQYAPRKKVNADFDTIICPAQKEGFENAFLNKKAWWAIRINDKKIDSIKYIAMYQVAPVSAITHYGEVDRIAPYQDTKKYIVYLKGDPIALDSPILLGEEVNLSPQGPRYSTLAKIQDAKRFKEVFE